MVMSRHACCQTLRLPGSPAVRIRAHRKRPHQSRPSYRGFTLTEMVVVIASVSIVAACVIPATIGAREAARRASCQSNLAQWAMAAQSHAQVFGHLPMAGADSGSFDGNGQFLPANRALINSNPAECLPATGKLQRWSWIYALLPYVDQKNLYFNCDDAFVRSQVLEQSICPSRRAAEVLVAPPGQVIAMTDYAINLGTYTWGNPALSSGSPGVDPGVDDPGQGTTAIRHNGTADRLRPVTLASITDGLSHTLLFGEKAWCTRDVVSDGDFTGWTGGVDPAGVPLMLNGVRRPILTDTARSSRLPPKPDNGDESCSILDQFGSAHAEGFNIACADGSVKTVSYNIGASSGSMTVFRNLTNRSDGQHISTQIPAGF